MTGHLRRDLGQVDVQVVDRRRTAEVGVGDQAELAEGGQGPVDAGPVDPGRRGLGPAGDLVRGQVPGGPVEHLDDRRAHPGDPLAAGPEPSSAARTRGRPAEPCVVARIWSLSPGGRFPGSIVQLCDDVASNSGRRAGGHVLSDDHRDRQHRTDPAPARARREALAGRDVRLRRAAARAGLGHAGRDRGAAALRHRRGRRAGRRGGTGRLHTRDAACLRRRPHRRHRQHHPQADGRAAAADVGRLLVLPRPLHASSSGWSP